MKDYEAYMNRQRLSENSMARLIRLEETGRKGVTGRYDDGAGTVTRRCGDGTQGVESRWADGENEVERRNDGKKRAPQWVKYCAMAASFVVAVGVFALTMFQLGGRMGIDPIANASATPAAEELYFNEVVSVPFTDDAIAGDMTLTPMEIGDVALLFGSSEDDFDAFKEDMGWGKFDMEYYSVDMGSGSNGWRFLLKGDYVSLQEQEWYSNFYPANNIWLEIYEGHSYLSEEAWQVPVVPYNDTEYCKFIPCQVNGHKVIAACEGHDYQASAVFDVECNGKTYGVLYSVTAYGEENAKELVTKLVRRVTKDGLYPETYNVGDDLTLSYTELTEISPNRQICDIKSDDTDRELSGDELKKVFPAVEEELDYQWRGNGLFHGDGTLRVLTIEGIRHDGSACVTITAGAEEDVFLMNSEVTNGKVTYVGAENQLWNGVDLMRGYYRYAPKYYWWWDGDTLDNACLVSFQCQQSSRDLPIEITTCVKTGTLEENKTFNQQWVNTTLGKGLWLSCEERNGKMVWDLPEVEKPVELSGSYFMELGDEETVVCPVMIFYDDGDFVCVSDLASSHICDGTFAIKNGQVTTSCDQHRFVFDILDENTLRYVGEKSDEMVRYVEPKVTDGAVFRRTLDSDGNFVIHNSAGTVYDSAGKASYDHAPFNIKFGEGVSWKDHPTGDEEPIVAWNQADTPVENIRDGGSVWVWGEETHHPEPSAHVEANHHEEEHHSSSHH